MIDKQKLMEEATVELAKYHDRTISFYLALPDAIVVVAALQLSLRHPNHPIYSKEKVRRDCDAIIQIVETISPTIATFMRLGYDTKNDEG